MCGFVGVCVIVNTSHYIAHYRMTFLGIEWMAGKAVAVLFTTQTAF